MRKRIFLTGWSLLLLAASLFAQEKWTLQQCVDYATQNNISIKQADVQARISALQLKSAKLNPLPNASFSTGLGMQFGRSIDPTTNFFTQQQLLYQNVGVQGGINVYSFGQLKNITAAARFNADAALADIQRASYDVSVNVATYYLQILAAKEQINIARIQSEQTRSQLDDTRKRVDAGSLPELNLVELEAQLATDSANIVGAKSTFRQSLLQLQGLLNKDAAEPFDVETPPLEQMPLDPITELQPEYVYQLATTNHPKMRVDELRIKGAEKNILVSKSYLYPSFTFGYNLATSFSNSFKGVPFKEWWNGYGDQINNNFRQAFGVNVSVPIFNSGNTYRTNYERSKLDLRNVQLQKDLDVLTLKQDIYTAYNNAISSMEKYNIGVKSVTAAQKAYDFATKRYEVGLLSTIDLLTTQNKLFTAKLQQLNNQTDYVFRMKLLESYKGLGMRL